MNKFLCPSCQQLSASRWIHTRGYMLIMIGKALSSYSFWFIWIESSESEAQIITESDLALEACCKAAAHWKILNMLL